MEAMSDYIRCPGGREAPKDGTVTHRNLGPEPGRWPGRGDCTGCGTNFKLTWDGLIRRHLKKVR